MWEEALVRPSTCELIVTSSGSGPGRPCGRRRGALIEVSATRPSLMCSSSAVCVLFQWKAGTVFSPRREALRAALSCDTIY